MRTVKVLKKIGYQIPQDVIEQVVNCQPGAIEGVLHALKGKLAAYAARNKGDVSQRGPEDSPVSYTPAPAKPQHVSAGAPPAAAAVGFGAQQVMMGGGGPAHGVARQGAAPPVQAMPAPVAAPAPAPAPALPLSKTDPSAGGDAARIIAEKNQTIQELRETIEVRTDVGVAARVSHACMYVCTDPRVEDQETGAACEAERQPNSNLVCQVTIQ